MRNRLERRRLTLRAAALCIVLVLLCGCLLPAFAEGTAPDSVPGQTQDEDGFILEGEDAGELDEPVFLPAKGGSAVMIGLDEEEPGSLDDTELPELPDDPDSSEGKADEYFEMTYLFWLSEQDEDDGGLPYAEQAVGSGGELLLPEEPEAEGKTFRYWYSRDDDGTAVRFIPAEEPLWPEEDGECSLYAYFTADTQQDEPAPDEEESPALDDLPGLTEEADETGKEDETLPDEAEQPENDISLEEDASLTDDRADEDALPAEEEDTEDAELFAANRKERAAVFLLKSPTCLPGSNDPSQWAPDNSECKWIGQVNISRNATWDNGKNILDNVSDYIVSWPDGSTGDVWTLEPGDAYWDEVIDEIWDEYKDTIEKETGISGLTKSDLESITVTPYKISRYNNTEPDKHIDCTISVKSKKSFTARFNVRYPGANNYTTVDSQEYQRGERVELTEKEVEPEISIGGVLYVFEGWYSEIPGPVTDEPGGEQVEQEQWDVGYLPDEDELENGVVNFYAHYVLADMEPDTGVTVDFSALPLMLGAGAAILGCKNKKKEEEE